MITRIEAATNPEATIGRTIRPETIVNGRVVRPLDSYPIPVVLRLLREVREAAHAAKMADTATKVAHAVKAAQTNKDET